MRLLAICLITLMFLVPSVSAETTCNLTPLTLPLFDATPLAVFATPSASPQVTTLSEADATDVLETYVACTNTDDPTLVWAMFTPRWFSSTFAGSKVHITYRHSSMRSRTGMTK